MASHLAGIYEAVLSLSGSSLHVLLKNRDIYFMEKKYPLHVGLFMILAVFFFFLSTVPSGQGETSKKKLFSGPTCIDACRGYLEMDLLREWSFFTKKKFCIHGNQHLLRGFVVGDEFPFPRVRYVLFFWRVMFVLLFFRCSIDIERSAVPDCFKGTIDQCTRPAQKLLSSGCCFIESEAAT